MSRAQRISALQFSIWLAFGMLICLHTTPARAENWPGWRGPSGDGHSAERSLPLKWSPDGNVAWKIELKGEGHASPIVWDDHIFLVSCVPEPQTPASSTRALTAYSRSSGQMLWERTVITSPLETKHALNSYASSTPVTDGKYVYVTFLESDNRTVVATNVSQPRDVTVGRMVVAAYDFEGQQRWISRPGEFVSVHGYCSCPVLYKNLLIVNGDHDGDSYIVALNQQTGEQVWKVPRQHKTRSYVTPIIREFGGRTQMILSGSKSVTAYDPETGELIWNMDGPTEQFVASMVEDGQHVFLTAGYPDKHILAIDPTGKGNVTESHVVWRSKQNCAYVPSPIVADNYLLLTSDDGIASCYAAQTGERVAFTRLGNHYSTSPIAANGLVYFTADNGITKIVRPGKDLQVVAENKLGEECYASVAASQGHLYFRTTRHLISIGQ